ncbi:DUF4123 domain-containing protein [Pseudomonas syringae]|uniref:DUF4123 domain-containing protein n=1 Tax=Pseudomonas syringae TaxID=317 RepID=A0A085VDB5_PSESX|nr:DUF4123 domain-containing protein [Pseudomonas syringae]KFE53428.1 hypothetical protein IV01_19940 [Pseudomonas syringae]
MNMTSINPLPDDFPWNQTAGLLLDALQVKDLLRRVYEWSAAAQVDVLYLGTQWASISHCSPCLIRLRDRDDPVLLQFLANTQHQWGYLLVSDCSWQQLLAHMRWLTSFQAPQYEEMYLRISDPAVARALFGADAYPRSELFGPCQQIMVANTSLSGWTHYRRPAEPAIPMYEQPYTASDAQWAALKALAFDKSIAELYLHMQRFFPEYRADLSPQQRLEHVHKLARSAIARGFESEREIRLYANVFGFLGHDVLAQHPDISELLTVKSELTSVQRAERAAELAAQRSGL